MDAGTSLGSYKIVAPLGAGGMGEVYLALDAKLDRRVAVKILPERMTRSPESAARFRREAKLLASLNHLNIGQIYGFEEDGDKKFLVLEYIEGETLAARLKHGPLPVGEGLEVCRQIAAALEAAHEKGIIHRDLKPGNIMVRPDGAVKVLDFGVARAFRNDAGGSGNLAESPTLTDDFTRPGTIIGTAAYMSPEQARGKHLDKRTDIWSFGCVLFECLGGCKPFAGETTTDLIAKILEREPSWEDLPADTPPYVKTVLRQCLQKDRKNRLRDAGDVGLMLSGLEQAAEEGRPSGQPAGGANRRLAITAGVSAIVATMIAGLAVWRAMQPKPLQVVRLEVPQAPGQEWEKSMGPTIAISPDGEQIAYRSRIRNSLRSEEVLVLRRLGAINSVVLPGLGRDVSHPFFSADGSWVGFVADAKLKKVSSLGGAPVTICDLGTLNGLPYGMDWNRNGMIAFGHSLSGGIYEVSENGGTPRLLSKIADDEFAHKWPQFLPDGKTILMTVDQLGPQNFVALLSRSTGRYEKLIPTADSARYIAPRYLVYMQGKKMWVDTFDVDSLQLGGKPVRLDEPIKEGSIAANGNLIYSSSSKVSEHRTLAWVDRHGIEAKSAFPSAPFDRLTLSGSGSRVALELDYGDHDELWIGDTARETMARLAAEDATWAIWDADDEHVIWYTPSNGALTRQRADGSDRPEQHGEFNGLPQSMSPGGNEVILTKWRADTGPDVWHATLDGKPAPLIVEPGNQYDVSISTDGHWLAYDSDKSGAYEVYITRFPVEHGARKVLVGLGGVPTFSHDGTELFYQTTTSIYSVTINTEPTLAVGNPVRVCDGLNPNTLGRNYDVMPDGQRFLIIKEDPMAPEPRNEIHVVVNWVEVLKAKLGY